MALTKVRGKGLGTLGDGTASDNSIVFDGNAQDFHIGLDDSSDSLTIGLGSTLGTTSHMVMDANGNVTKPLQPAFLAYGGASWTTISGGSTGTMTISNQIYDVGNNFNTSNYRFTAPVAGKYFLHIHSYVRLETTDDDANHAYVRIYINGGIYVQSNSIFGYYNHGDPDQAVDVTLVADMAANDYATCALSAASGDASYYGGACQFMGYLIC